MEDALIAGLLRRNPEAIDGWHRRDHPRIYRLAFGLPGDRQETGDLTAAALLRILDRREQRDPAACFGAWSTRVVIDTGRDRLRRARRA